MAASGALGKLMAQLPRVVDEYFERTRAAEQARERETKAVLKIQAAARGFLVRRRIDLLSVIVVTIQRYWRGYLGRLRACLARETRDKALRKAYFDAKATTIQRHWRGFYSRKHLFDFYARKAYLRSVRQKNAEVRQYVNEEAERAAEQQRQMAEEAARRMFDDKIGRLHHLLSTAAQPSIFSSPFAVATGSVPVIAGVPVEEHLKAAFRAQVSQRLPPLKKVPPKPHSPHDVYPPEAPAVFNPGAKLHPRITLRQAVPYDAVHQADLLEGKIQRAEMLTRHPQPFASSLRRPEAPGIDPQSNRNMERYIDPFDPTVGIRNERFTAPQRKISPRPFQRYQHKQPFFDPIANSTLGH